MSHSKFRMVSKDWFNREHQCTYTSNYQHPGAARHVLPILPRALTQLASATDLQTLPWCSAVQSSASAAIGWLQCSAIQYVCHTHMIILPCALLGIDNAASPGRFTKNVTPCSVWHVCCLTGSLRS